MKKWLIAFSFQLSAFSLLFAFSAQAVTIPNDPFYGQQWYLAKIGAPLAWDTSTGSREVVVAVLDTGVNIDHPDLSANIWRNTREVPRDGIDNDRNGFIDDVNGWNFVEKDNDPRPHLVGNITNAALTHGTLIASIIAGIGNNNEGIAGIAWATKIMPIRVLDSEGEGNSTDVIAGLRYAVAQGAKVVNLSFTTFDNIPQFTQAIAEAKNRGVIVVAAAGNDEAGGGVNMDARPVYPACTDGPAGENWVIGVAATDRSDMKTRFSNYGSVCVDIAAPGREIFGAQFTTASIPSIQSYGGNWAGTSLAAPQVAGAAALLMGMSPNLSRNDIIDALLGSATPIDATNTNYRGRLGHGRLDLARAVTTALARGREVPVARVLVAGEAGTVPRVWMFDRNGTLVGAFLAYAETFRGGVRMATGDVDGDRSPDIVTVPGPGGGPQVRVFDQHGTLVRQFFALNQNQRNGGTVAVGDVDGDGASEIVIGAGAGIGPTVQVWSGSGMLRAEFLVYAPTFTGGVEVAVGDVDGDGRAEIVTAVAGKGGPHVRIFDGAGKVEGQFFAYDKSYRGGMRVGTSDSDGDRVREILITESIPGSAVRIFTKDGELKNTITAFVPKGAVPLTPGGVDFDLDRKDEIIVAVGGARPELRGFNRVGALTHAFQLPAELKTALRVATF